MLLGPCGHSQAQVPKLGQLCLRATRPEVVGCIAYNVVCDLQAVGDTWGTVRGLVDVVAVEAVTDLGRSGGLSRGDQRDRGDWSGNGQGEEA